ncbi:response regulator transcription factor [Streptomyces sp. NPDC046685]|uniref:response regulator transcription factor n=1 Tax=Streptomyces sp. NPDC046685 TaxID=3157202 RepID=UPI0033D37378
MRILVVEDDAHVRDALGTALRQRGHAVIEAADGRQALTRAEEAEFILLDLGLPDLDGLQVCKRIRERSAVPIIAVTARSEEIDRVMGLHMGADDYVVKPYSLHELIARIEAVSRRTCRCRLGPDGHDPACHGEAGKAGAATEAGPLRIDRKQRAAALNGRDLQLTRKEFDLLAMLVEDTEAVHTREAIVARVWDENWFGSTRTLDVHVGTLRRKLGAHGWIENIRGVGFRLCPPAEQG